MPPGDHQEECQPRHSELLRRYTGASLAGTAAVSPGIKPWLVLQDIPLATQVVSRVASLLDQPIAGHVCVLADSGLPVGVLLAQVLSAPMHFYRRSPWQIDDDRRPFHVYPPIPQGEVALLVDSHILTGFTSATCADLVRASGSIAHELAVPVSFAPADKELPFRAPDLQYRTLGSLADCAPLLATHFSTSDNAILHARIAEALRKPTREPFPRSALTSDGYIEPKSARFLMLARAALSPRAPQVLCPDPHLAGELRRDYPSTEAGIWSLVCDPAALAPLCDLVNGLLSSDPPRVLIGTGYLGTIFAISLSLRFPHPPHVLSTLSAVGWDRWDLTTDLRTSVICSGRIRTGYIVTGAARLARRYGLTPSHVVALRFCPEAVGYPRRKALSQLASHGLSITALS